MGGAIAIAVGRRILDSLKLLLNVRPVFVKRVGHSRLGSGDDIGPSEHIKPPLAREVADIDSVRARRLENVDVPVVNAAMNRDVTNVSLRGGGCVFAGDIHDAENGAGGVPVLTERGPGTRQGRTAQFPVCMQPV